MSESQIQKRLSEILAALTAGVSVALTGLTKGAGATDSTTLRVIRATDQPVGAEQDGGSQWVPGHLEPPFHGDASVAGGVAISVLPTSGQKLVLRDCYIKATAACEVSIIEETAGTVKHGPVPLQAGEGFWLITRSQPMSKLATADKHYMVQSTTADHVTVEAWTSSEL